MSSFARKIKKNNEVYALKTLFGKEPKHRCPECHQMTLYQNKKCVYCSGVFEETKEKFVNYMKRKMLKSKEQMAKKIAEENKKPKDVKYDMEHFLKAQEVKHATKS